MTNSAALLMCISRREFLAVLRAKRPWLRPAEAAAYLDVSVRCLEDWRARGRGPAFRGKRKGIRYHIEALDQFLAVQRLTPS